MKISVKTDTITPHLQGMRQKLEDPEPALLEVGESIAAMATEAFSNPGLRPESWPPLKPATLERKAKKKYGSEPLVASGALARSPRVVRTISYSANEHSVVVGSDRRIDNNVPKNSSKLAKGLSLAKVYGMSNGYSLAGIHQLGAPKANIPARPFFPFGADGKATPTAIERVKEILLRWLKK